MQMVTEHSKCAIEDDTITRIKKAIYYTVTVDESTDISTSKNLVMMARFVEKSLFLPYLIHNYLKWVDSQLFLNCYRLVLL